MLEREGSMYSTLIFICSFTGKSRTTVRQDTSSATSRSRSSSSSASSRPTSTRPIERPSAPEETPNEDPTPKQVADPVEQRWEESAGNYTHKKFKKMASSVVVETPAPAEQPLQQQAQQSLPLKHSALSLIETPRPPVPANFHQPVSSRVHVPPPSPSSLVIDDSEPKRKNVCPYCNISCAKPSVLDKHIRTHTNERPYPCNQCQIAFKTQSNYYKHCRSRTHALKVEQGIDSSSAEMMAELGESFREELDKPNSEPRTVLISTDQQPRDFRLKATSVAIIPQQSQQQNHRIVNARIPATIEPPRPVAESIPQHIDKIISHNQTIVETLDPLWPKRYMRHKEDQQQQIQQHQPPPQQQSVVTLEKASPVRKFITTNSGQVTMSLVNSKPTTNHPATLNLVTGQPVTSSPLSIHLARSQPQPTITMVPSGLRIEQTPLMVVEQSKRDEVLNSAKSVKEVFLNSINRAPAMPHPNQPKLEGSSMIQELLIKTRGATTLEPAGPVEQRRDSASSNGSNGSQIIFVPKEQPQMKLLPNVSLILPPNSSAPTSNLTVTSIPVPQKRILPQSLFTQAPNLPTEVIRVRFSMLH